MTDDKIEQQADAVTMGRAAQSEASTPGGETHLPVLGTLLADLSGLADPCSGIPFAARQLILTATGRLHAAYQHSQYLQAALDKQKLHADIVQACLDVRNGLLEAYRDIDEQLQAHTHAKNEEIRRLKAKMYDQQKHNRALVTRLAQEVKWYQAASEKIDTLRARVRELEVAILRHNLSSQHVPERLGELEAESARLKEENAALKACLVPPTLREPPELREMLDRAALSDAVTDGIPLPDFPTSLRQCGKALMLTSGQPEMARHANTLLEEAARRLELQQTIDAPTVKEFQDKRLAQTVEGEPELTGDPMPKDGEVFARWAAYLANYNQWESLQRTAQMYDVSEGDIKQVIRRSLRIDCSKNRHDGDCTIYATRDHPGDAPENGICTCGYGHEQRFQDAGTDQMYSAQLEAQMKSRRFAAVIPAGDGLALKWFRLEFLQMGARRFAEWLGHPRPSAILNVEQGRRHDEDADIGELLREGKGVPAGTASGRVIAEALRDIKRREEQTARAVAQDTRQVKTDDAALGLATDIAGNQCLLVQGTPKCGYDGPEVCDHTQACCERLGGQWAGPPRIVTEPSAEEMAPKEDEPEIWR